MAVKGHKATNIGENNIANQGGTGNTANHEGDNNRTVQRGVGNFNGVTGSTNNTGQLGDTNFSRIQGKENDTYQHGDRNVSTIKDANKARIGFFKTSGLQSDVKKTDEAEFMEGAIPEGWSWDGWWTRFVSSFSRLSSS